MIFSTTVWITVQVSIVCIVAIALSYLARGRHPQSISAILSGALIGSLLLTIAWCVPNAHWSIAVSVNTQQSELVATPNQVTDGVRSDVEDPTNLNYLSQLIETPSNETELDATNKSPTSTFGVDLIRSCRVWFGQHVQRIDDRIQSHDTTLADASILRPWRILMIVSVAVLISLCLWCLAYGWIRRIIRSSESVDETSLLELVREFSCKLRLRRIPSIRTTRWIHAGATIGILKPIVLIHRDWHTWEPEQVRAVVAHELAHVLRRDYFWSLLGSLFRVVFCFHPLSYWFVGRLRLEQELAADQLAAGLIGEAKAYGRALAGLALRCDDLRWAASPVVAASSIDLVRRISMLKQGSLKSKNVRRRWCCGLFAMTVLCIVPLSGLRGVQSQQPSDPPQETVSVVAEKPVAVALNAIQSTEGPSQLNQAEIDLVCPPMTAKGIVYYAPGKFDSKTVSQTARWISGYSSAVLFGEQPKSTSQLTGLITWRSQWTDVKKEHGRGAMQFEVKRASSLNVGVIQRFIQPGVHSVVVGKDIIDGCEVTGVANRAIDPISKNMIEPTEPSFWILDNELGYIQGTQGEIAEFISEARAGRMELWKEHPSFQDSLFGFRFEDCSGWQRDAESFLKDSQQEAAAAIGMPLLSGLVDIEGHLKTDNSDYISIRVRYRDDAIATQAKASMDVLVQMLQASIVAEVGESDKPSKVTSDQINKEIQIQLDGDVVVVQVGFKTLFESMIEPDALTGWQAMFAGAPAQTKEGVLLTKSNDPMQLLPVSLSQYVDAVPYRNQRVRMTLSSNVSDEDASQQGLFLWASDDKGESLAFANDSLRGQTVELDVPSDASTLSFGLFVPQLKQNLLLRSCSIESIGLSSPVSLANSRNKVAPYSVNLFVLPGKHRLDRPIHLDFQASAEERVVETANANSANSQR
jgi:beta-lactamase regulating signal transducer with metallopeptidase domain